MISISISSAGYPHYVPSWILYMDLLLKWITESKPTFATKNIAKRTFLKFENTHYLLCNFKCLEYDSRLRLQVVAIASENKIVFRLTRISLRNKKFDKSKPVLVALSTSSINFPLNTRLEKINTIWKIIEPYLPVR